MDKRFYSAPDFPVADTPKGKIRGYLREGVFTFKGIKYANAKRFQMPEPVEAWEGTKDALNYGWCCPTLTDERRDTNINLDHRFYPKDEDCQWLNIWTTSLDKNAKKPVMLWIHGGGFANCSAIELLCADGDQMCKYGDVVMVSLNHRLNILGFLDVSAYGEKYWNSGNAGLADLVIALQWIHDNIEAFGGDPENVTIFGQSGGGGKVCSLLQCPSADGLFQKAIVHSGIHERRDRPDSPTSKILVGEMLKYLNIAPENIEELETVPYRTLVEAYDAVMPGLRQQGLDVDGWAPLNNGYYQGYARLDGFYEHALTVPTMIGTCFAEFGRHPEIQKKYFLTREEILERIRSKYGDDTDRLVELFEKAYPEKNLMDVLVMDSDVRYGSLDHLTKRCAFEGSAPVYSYMYAQEFKNYNNGLPAFHCAELPVIFHKTSECTIYLQDGMEKLEDEMAGAWAAFAHTGNPNHEGMAEWPKFESDTRYTMVFNENTAARADYDTELIKFKKEVDPPFFMPGHKPDKKGKKA